MVVLWSCFNHANDMDTIARLSGYDDPLNHDYVRVRDHGLLRLAFQAVCLWLFYGRVRDCGCGHVHDCVHVPRRLNSVSPLAPLLALRTVSVCPFLPRCPGWAR